MDRERNGSSCHSIPSFSILSPLSRCSETVICLYHDLKAWGWGWGSHVVRVQHWSQEHTNRKEIARQLQPVYLMTRHVHSASGRATSVAATSPLRPTHTRADHTTHGLFVSFSHYLSYLTVSLESLIIRLLGIGTFIHLYLLNQQSIIEVVFKMPSASLCLGLQSSENAFPILRCIKVM